MCQGYGEKRCAIEDKRNPLESDVGIGGDGEEKFGISDCLDRLDSLVS